MTSPAVSMELNFFSSYFFCLQINLTEPTSKAEENEKVDSKMKAFKKPLSVFKGPLLHIR